MVGGEEDRGISQTVIVERRCRHGVAVVIMVLSLLAGLLFALNSRDRDAGTDSATPRSGSAPLPGRQGSMVGVSTDHRPLVLLQHHSERGDANEFAVVRAGDPPSAGVRLAPFGSAIAAVASSEGMLVVVNESATSRFDVIRVDAALTKAEVVTTVGGYGADMVGSLLLVGCGQWTCTTPTTIGPADVSLLTILPGGSYRYMNGPLVSWGRISASATLPIMVRNVETGDTISGAATVLPLVTAAIPYGIVPKAQAGQLEVRDLRSNIPVETFDSGSVTPTRQFDKGRVLFYSSCPAEPNWTCAHASHIVDLRSDPPRVILGPEDFLPRVLIDDFLVGNTSGALSAVKVTDGRARLLLPARAHPFPAWEAAQVIGANGNDLVAWSTGTPLMVALGNLDHLDPIQIPTREDRGSLYQDGGSVYAATVSDRGWVVDSLSDGTVHPVAGPAPEVGVVGQQPRSGLVLSVQLSDGTRRLQTTSGRSVNIGSQTVCQTLPIDDRSSLVTFSNSASCAGSAGNVSRVDFETGQVTRSADGWQLADTYLGTRQDDLLASWPPLISDDFPIEPWEPYLPDHPYHRSWSSLK